ncbi:DNA recombination protein RmuC [Sphingomonas sp. SM33]|uniref:DNA recombination protein RmuC homolog n=1 Tax=Sphingomonas telluris TaxID=2907998 RepID=A0ABS9VJR2_9SPHN|nr:DNA recombination protein RmuC [Sphingomonas telluris]MCH8615211.1 DNA recombination protein RmuC [Sphingomonas telluris]
MGVGLVAGVLAALAVGALIGWLIGSRDGVGAKQTVDSLRLQLDEVVKERDANRDAAQELAAVKAAQEARERAFEERIAEMTAAREALSAQFAEVGSKLLEGAQKQFLERAEQRFRQSEESAGTNLKALLQPVHERLQRYEDAVTKVEEERRKDFGLLTGHIEAMKSGTERVSAEAAKLVNALRNAPKARGRWGEQQLRNVLESCGLTEHCDFETEVSRTDEDGGRLRPDVTLRVPGGHCLVIDAKVSLNAYQDAFGAVDESERAMHLTAHAAAIKAHVNTLGNKAYWAQFADAPDYVVMFIPGEHFLSAALEQDGKLWDYAFERRVLLATPTNLIAIARTVAAVWRQEKLAKEARQIGELGKELYDRLAKAAQDLKRVGGGLTTAVNNYNSFVSSFETRSLVTARKFRELNIEPGAREIEIVPPVEALPRYNDDEEPPQIAAE